MEEHRLVFTVSTVRDSPHNVRRWVRRNLAHGVDHMIVFLDAPAPRVRQLLDEHPHVTCIRTDETWWHGKRPPRLNHRQVVNANAARLVLAEVGCAEWLFHIDADEVVVLDRDELAGFPETTRAVRLLPKEAVSLVRWTGEVTRFKRLLDEDELALLHVLGVIEHPHNNTYFNGHVVGKVGVRPDVEVMLGVHDARVVVDDEFDSHPDLVCQGSTLLHYESVDAAEFLRKWTTMLDAGPGVAMREQREPLRRAMRALVSKGLPAPELEALATMVFERTRLDDVELLDRLGLLDHVDAEEGTHRPAAVGEGSSLALARAWESVAAVEDKIGLAPRRHDPATARAVLEAVRRSPDRSAQH